jgi:general secretion pathway protein K
MPIKIRQRGAALLMAMLTVALVATLAAGALWQQWRSVEIEASERSRVQAGWILSGALDWARLILREDARSGAVDHLGEPWSIGLSESRLSTFLAMDRTNTDLEDDVFLSGQITDAQSRMNVMNLIVGGKVSEPDRQAFTRLFELLGLDPAELDQMSSKLLLAIGAGTGATATPRQMTRRHCCPGAWSNCAGSVCRRPACGSSNPTSRCCRRIHNSTSIPPARRRYRPVFRLACWTPGAW